MNPPMPTIIPSSVQDALLLCLLLTFSSSGLAQLVRTLPLISESQGWLEGTWTKGKPLTCWVCLVGWCGLLQLLVGFVVCSPIAPPCSTWGLCLLVAAWLGSVGIGGLALSVLRPILPAAMAWCGPEIGDGVEGPILGPTREGENE